MAIGKFRRECTYSVDYGSFASAVMPSVWKSVESRLYPLAQQRGLEVRRDEAAVKTDKGHPVGGISNFTWKARQGLSPGFTVELKHDARNYFRVQLSLRPYLPLAILVAVGLGVALSFFWLPYLINNYSALIQNPLFLVGVVAMWIFLVLLTRTIFLAGILAVLSTAAFGFIGGYGLGWLIGMALARSDKGGLNWNELRGVLDALTDPTQAASARQPYYPPAGALQYASPAAGASLGSPLSPAPYIPTAALVGSQAFPASTISMAACPQCRNPVAVGAMNCPACSLGLQWS